MNFEQKSPYSYGVAVILCGLFGILGIHHFYLRNYTHGMFDLGLFILSIVLLFNQQLLLAFLAITIDALHSLVVFYLLIAEQAKDGAGRPVRHK